jgi:hypothetical protein
MSACASSNPFRAAWLYHRLPAGDAVLAAGKGLSPAFLNLLGAIDAAQPVAFGALEQQFPAQDADDLELWLAELCRMQLIEPATAPADRASVPGAHAGASPAPAAHAADEPSLLLVHKLPSTRLAWRDLLAHLPLQLHEAGTLEEADHAFNRLRPKGVIVGPEGGDFNALNLIHVLKHPRAPIPTRVFLVLDDRPASERIKAAAARADDTVHAEDWASLAERVARQLGLPAPHVPAAPPPLVQQLPDVLAGGQQYIGPALSALEEEHPRIAAIVADQWSQSTLDELFDELIFDDRGSRVGFCPAAMEDLLLLYRVHRELQPLEEAWQADTRPRGRKAARRAMRMTGRHPVHIDPGRLS